MQSCTIIADNLFCIENEIDLRCGGYLSHELFFYRQPDAGTPNLRRIGNIAQRCSNRLYANEHIPIEDIQITSVAIEEFIGAFHHGKEGKSILSDYKKQRWFFQKISENS